MRFVVISQPKHMIPPEMIIPIIEGFSAFIEKYTASGHIVETWSYAGTTGGGALINADSHEELDAIMAENPVAGFSATEVYPVVDIQESVQRGLQIARARMEAMAQMGGG